MPPSNRQSRQVKLPWVLRPQHPQHSLAARTARAASYHQTDFFMAEPKSSSFCLFGYWFGATPGHTQSLLLALFLGITPGRFGGLEEVLGSVGTHLCARQVP